MDKMTGQGMDRREAVRLLLRDRGDLLLVTGLGSPTYDAAAVGDDDRNFYLWGAMGGAAMMGLGLAKARPGQPVLVITGDGEQLMGLGALATIGKVEAPNLSIVVLDNGVYGETPGMQESHTATGVRLDRVATECGFDWTCEASAVDEIQPIRERIHKSEGRGLAVLKIASALPERILPARDGVFLKNRFRAAIGFGPN